VITFRCTCGSAARLLAFKLSKVHIPSISSFLPVQFTIVNVTGLLEEIEKKKKEKKKKKKEEKERKNAGRSASFTRRQTFRLVKSGQPPAPASALSNAIRFVGEKDEGGCRRGEKEAEREREREREREKVGGQEKLLELPAINTLNFFPAARRISRARSSIECQ